MPGLCVTPKEVARLFGVPPNVCERVLSALAEEGALVLRPDGRYVHSTPSF